MIHKDRNTLFPILNRKLFDIYETQLQAFWTPDEIDFSGDLDDLNSMKPPARDLILKILAFFAQSDSIVNENLCMRFMADVNIPEMLQFYSIQVGIEAVHAHTYAKMIESYVSDADEKMKLFQAIENFPFIAQKASWMKKWIKSQDNFSKRLLAFALVEGVFFSASFCTIFWIREQGLMPGLSLANTFISRDEGLHWEAASVLYKELVSTDNKVKSKQFFINSRLEDKDVSDAEIGNQMREINNLKKVINEEFKKLTQKDVEEMVKEAVDIEKAFVKDSLQVGLLGINNDMLCQYVESVADMVAEAFGFDAIYGTRVPFDFMLKNDIRGKVNFFERRVSEYKKAKREKVNFDVVEDNF